MLKRSDVSEEYVSKKNNSEEVVSEKVLPETRHTCKLKTFTERDVPHPLLTRPLPQQRGGGRHSHISGDAPFAAPECERGRSISHREKLNLIDQRTGKDLKVLNWLQMSKRAIAAPPSGQAGEPRVRSRLDDQREPKHR